MAKITITFDMDEDQVEMLKEFAAVFENNFVAFFRGVFSEYCRSRKVRTDNMFATLHSAVKYVEKRYPNDSEEFKSYKVQEVAAKCNIAGMLHTVGNTVQVFVHEPIGCANMGYNSLRKPCFDERPDEESTWCDACYNEQRLQSAAWGL